MLGEAHTAIKDHSVNCEFEWNKSIEKHAPKLEAMADEHFRARAAGLRDVGELVQYFLA